MRVANARLLAGCVILITAAAGRVDAQDTTGRRDTVPLDTAPLFPPPAPVPPPPPPQAPAPPPPPTIEQIRYQDGLRTAGRGVAQLRDGVDRVQRTQQASDTVARRRAAQRLGGLCTAARSFINSGRPRLQANAYEDSLRVLAKQVVVRLDTLNNALPECAKTARREPTAVASNIAKRLKAYEDALLALRTALTAQNKPDSTKTVSQQ